MRLFLLNGDQIKSDFQVGSSGDRSYFYYHNLNDITTRLAENNFEELLVLLEALILSAEEIVMSVVTTQGVYTFYLSKAELFKIHIISDQEYLVSYSSLDDLASVLELFDEENILSVRFK